MIASRLQRACDRLMASARARSKPSQRLLACERITAQALVTAPLRARNAVASK